MNFILGGGSKKIYNFFIIINKFYLFYFEGGVGEIYVFF